MAFTHIFLTFFIYNFFMSRNENVTIKIKYSKVKNLEKICSYFSQDYTAIQTAQKTGISRQTVNNYYKLLRTKITEEFNYIDEIILKEILETKLLHIKYINVYKTDIFYIKYKNKILVLDELNSYENKLSNFLQSSLKNPLTKHKRANCARVLLCKDNQTFLLSGFLKDEDDSFEDYLQTRLKQFRGISKEKLFFYLKESQIRFNSPSEMIYQKIMLSFIKN